MDVLLKVLKQLRLPPELQPLKKELKKVLKEKHSVKVYSAEDEELIAKIKAETIRLNKNNVTRTQAYYDYYQECPEIHWSFLAHMVSRNAGWNMTDLRGEFLSRILNGEEQKAFFAFLERGNWLIFQDAYPQLLLYREWKRTRKNRFHLLADFHVSAFMEVVWNHYLQSKDVGILTHGLIINEQNYIQSRVMNNAVFQKNVVDTLEFKLQDYLAFNHILFPYMQDGNVSLKGDTVHQFQHVEARIRFGKKLYQILFSTEKNQVKQWAAANQHTGSRKDYWSHLFSDIQDKVPDAAYTAKLQGCHLKNASSRLYSPQLLAVWDTFDHEPAQAEEWCKDWRILYLLKEEEAAGDGRIEADYCQSLEGLELAALAKKVISVFT
ncbi:DUF2515 family protein [Cytobacillus gottheilii]|uniref:DUF2515 family protein n=1 Tax=Cytobacillus gottheilii TaxID=859144 RepID=A0ABX8FEH0_9BACI|nr:DUF2515 family protein [Cytobacillus gottheilii]QVY62417.1 DUF2515 family protein [Cytobacillus gottheilii]